MEKPILKAQEIPFDDADSNNFFDPGEKTFVATRAALEIYSQETIIRCLEILQGLAGDHEGIDSLQVFDDPDRREALWFMENEGVITALLPSDH